LDDPRRRIKSRILPEARRRTRRPDKNDEEGPTMPIQEQTMIDAIMHTRGQVDFLWQFFVTVQLAIFALLFIYDDAVDSMNRTARALAICAFGMFDWINGHALRGCYALLDALHQQYRADYGQSSRFQPALYELFVQQRYEGKESMLMLTHGLAFAVVMLALIWRQFIQHDNRPNTTESRPEPRR
jgi:hypothetical protein